VLKISASKKKRNGSRKDARRADCRHGEKNSSGEMKKIIKKKDYLPTDQEKKEKGSWGGIEQRRIRRQFVEGEETKRDSVQKQKGGCKRVLPQPRGKEPRA